MSDVGPDAPTVSRRERDKVLIGGIAWAAAARTGSQLATWIVSLLVARLLSPADYGVVAAATVYLGFVALVTEFGLATAIVSQRDLSDHAIAQLGGLSVLLGLAGWAVTLALAPLVATMLGMHELRQVLPVLGCTALLSSLNALPSALLQKQLRFKTQSNVELVRAFVASVSLLLLALTGIGYWALVLNQIIALVAVSAMLFAIVRYRVAFPRFRDIRGSLKITGQVLVSRAAWYTYSNADVAVASRTAGRQALGEYWMAWNLMTLPSEKIGSVIMGVTTGIFASVQKDLLETQRYFLRFSEAITLVLLPATIGMALVSPELVEVLLGQKWAATVPIIQALALATAVRTLGPICSQVLIARLQAGIVMRYSILAAVVLPLGFLVGAQFGTFGIALSWSIMSPPLLGYLLFITCREIQLPMRRVVRTLAGPIGAVAVMAATVWAVRHLCDGAIANTHLKLTLFVAVGVLAYSLAVGLFMRERFIAVRELLRRR